MERRAFERIPTNLYVRFYCNKMWHTGIVTNLSKSGICIETRKCFPLKSKFEIIMHSREAALKVTVSVIRLREYVDLFCCMGLELIEQPPDYVMFVDNVRSAFSVLKYSFSNVLGQRAKRDNEGNLYKITS